LFYFCISALQRHFFFILFSDQNNAPIKAEPGDNVVLTCKDPDQGKIKIAEWKRTDLGSSGSVLLYKDDQLDPGAQHPSYRDRVDLLCNQIMKGDVSLLLKNTTTDDSGTYECRIDTEKLEGKLISTVSLQVSPPPPPVQQVKVKSGEESVLLPLKVPHRLWFYKVEWRDGDNRTVHVYQNGSDQPGQQDKIYRTRTKMDENLLKTKNLSLTLRQPTYGDRGIFTCRVY
uniref:Ig-like domain-containing protein n=1 Tax=Poecilia formosa TaxID=48698 RepID=A0A087XZF2_POEFO